MLNYEVFWLREQQGGALGGDYGGRSAALVELPINETLAGRIHRLTPTGDVAARVRLPFLSHRDRKEWPTRQLELPVTADETGRVTVGDDAEHQFGALLAGPALGRRAAAPIIFRDARQFPATDWDTVIVPMLAAHRVRLEEPDWRPSGRIQVQWNIELPGRYARAWADIPHRREASFLEQFRSLSTSVQRALRLWLPYQYFASVQRLAKPAYAHPFLVYATLPSHPSRRKTQLTFHVLEPQRVVRSLFRMTKPLVEHLRRARLRMAAAGMDPALATAYHADEAQEMVRTMRGLPRLFGGLLALEAFIVEEFVSFAATAHDLRGADRRARELVDPGMELLHNIRIRLARSQGGEGFANLTNLVLATATAGLSGRDSSEGVLHVTVVVTDLERGKRVKGESQFSYATF